MYHRFSVRHIRFFAACLAFLSLILVGLGGYVRGTGAGLSCPDWPLCYGQAIPDSFQHGVAQEVFHRYLASLVSLGTLLLAVLAFLNRQRYPKIWFYMKLALGCLVCQIILGGLTVILLLNPLIVTGHLAFGTFFTQVLGLLALDPIPRKPADLDLRLLERPGKKPPRFYPRCVALFAVLVYFQIVLGGLVGSSGASLACGDIPFCRGALFPSGGSSQEFIHMLHRTNGVFLFCLAVVLTVFVPRIATQTSPRRGHMIGICALIFFQICLGFTSVFFRIPVVLAVGHLILAQMILFGTITYYRRIHPMRSIFVNSEKVSHEVDLGEYFPAKKNFFANSRF